MKAVIVSSSYSYLERTELLRECYRKKGYDTTVLMTDFVHTTKAYVEESREGYVFIKTKPYRRNISIRRLVSQYRFAKAVSRELEHMKMDLLHILIPANALTVSAKQYKDRHPQVKLYLDIIDLWPETMPIDHWKQTWPFRKWKGLRDKNLDNADIVYCECKLFQTVLKRENDRRFKTLYWISSGEPQESIPQLDDEALCLCYLGSINNIIDIDYLVRMSRELGSMRKLIFHIIGSGEHQEELIRKLKKTGAEVCYHGVIYDPKKKQEIFDQCHFGLNVMKSSVCVGLTMKSLDYFQAGLPILNNIQGDISELIDQYEIGYNGYQSLMERLPELKREDHMQMRSRVRSLYHERFTKEAFAAMLADMGNEYGQED